VNIHDLIKKVEEKRQRYFLGGGNSAIEKQHSKDKLTARERLNLLYDPGTFQEEDLFIRPIRTGFDVDDREMPGDAVVIGIGKIHGRYVYTYSHDFTVLSGTQSWGQSHKVTRVMRKAGEAGIPCVGMIDSGGVKIHDLFGRPANRPIVDSSSMGFSRDHFTCVSRNSGVIPQISMMIGPCYAGSAYSPIMADFVIMRKETSFMSVASPQLLKTVTFADITQEELGGAEVHARITGSCDFLAPDDEESIARCRELLSYLPSNWKEKPWKDSHLILDTGDDVNRRDSELLDIVSADLSSPYDMRDVIRRVLDKGYFLELQELYAPNMVIGFGRLSGKTVGIVANNPIAKGGYIDLDACDKEARFVRFCDAFNIPLIFFVDTPGFLPGLEQELSPQGLLRRAAKATFAVCEATVPKVSICIGNAHGPARLLMGTPREGTDMVFSWPQARVSRMAPKELVEKIWREEIGKATNPDAFRKEKYEELLDKHIDYPFHAAEYLMVDEIIDPRNTRPELIRRLEALTDKVAEPRPWRKHVIMPR